jgi:hypothetical protein
MIGKTTTKEDISASIKIAACVCARDGVISELEERAIFDICNEKFPHFSAEEIEIALTEFFDSKHQLEDYLALVDNKELRSFTLNMARESASADGLELNENIALEKSYIVWGVEKNV